MARPKAYGQRKLSTSDVAAEAGVSRPTPYRRHPSKEDLLAAFGLYEQAKFDQGMAQLVAQLRHAAGIVV